MKRSKATIFRDETPKRFNRVVEALQRLADLGNPRKCEYTEEQRETVIQALREEVERTEAAFRPRSRTLDLG